MGNHEFDEGVAELCRIQFGGCHPVDGCQDGDGFAGAEFPYLAANVTDKKTKLPILLPFTIKFVGGVPVAFVGMTLKGTPGIVNPAGITTVDFRDEVRDGQPVRQACSAASASGRWCWSSTRAAQQTARAAGPVRLRQLRRRRSPPSSPASTRPTASSSPATRTSFYSCALPNSSGANSVVTSAGTAGRWSPTSTCTLDSSTGRFVVGRRRTTSSSRTACSNADGTWQQDAAGNFVRNPALVDPAVKAIADKYRTAVAPIANRVVGSITRRHHQDRDWPTGEIAAR